MTSSTAPPPSATANDANSPDPKIIDLLNKRAQADGPFASLEFFPPRTEEGVKNLHGRMDRMLAATSPLFTDVTWGAGGSTAELSLQLALYAHQNGHVANMHLTCTNMEKDGDPKAAVRDALQSALDGGIRNIVALRGDPPAGESTWKAAEGGFTCALDLVRYIRQQFGDDFGVSVAGYPEGHPNAITELKEGEEGSMTESEKARCSVLDGKTFVCRDEDYKKEMDYLKEKVDAGADFIITQMFFDAEVYATFVKDCRDWGIDCPVVPGLMCINAYNGFKKMTKFCKTRVPAELERKMDSIKDDAKAIKAFGVEFGAKTCRALMEAGAPGLHFYTLNLEKVVYGILDELGISSSLAEKADEKDEKSMQAVGSAWAREGDQVTSIFGGGTVKEIRRAGYAAVILDDWVMAGGQKPTAYLRQDSYEKSFSG
eukprot:CAMPEP_0183299732 /NCGR_PEP_ID=MMETSP0160_2-20130417/6379_1 /TAXON_ID=2839 ORGANISM="Odontella Sinensis, Strain Grunow 1884" /NCGR_SAMPLE_ID=MMETSP0160_2 /ASSEMBLY_ACC=CAM_ASM_000250 /LENGTH=428 /DNA_ID=CAMNT_0025462031 /DNA_START=201 /DNA_END=1487 /DNA_ORIENTATION=+